MVLLKIVFLVTLGFWGYTVLKKWLLNGNNNKDRRTERRRPGMTHFDKTEAIDADFEELK